MLEWGKPWTGSQRWARHLSGYRAVLCGGAHRAVGTLRKPSLWSRRKKGLEGPGGAEIPAFPQFLCSSPRALVYDCPGIIFFHLVI